MIRIIQGDITTLRIDAIVNAANKSLLGGGGVDGAIHKAAGPALLKECRTLGGCNTGEAKITNGYSLPSSFVIHTVGPVWQGGLQNEDSLLKKAYLSSLQCALDNNIQSVAFPAISTGVYGYPFKQATRIALNTINTVVAEYSELTVLCCCFSYSDFDVYKNISDELGIDVSV